MAGLYSFLFFVPTVDDRRANNDKLIKPLVLSVSSVSPPGPPISMLHRD